MIAFSNESNGDGDENLALSAAENNGGHIGGRDDLPALTNLRVRSDARRLTKMVEAGEVAADKLPDLIAKATDRINSTKATARDIAALGALILAIAKAPDNQTTEHKHLHLHGEGGINVNYSDDWYGSKAANLAATDAASIAGVDVAKTIQTNGVRPTLGQNGGGPDSSN